MLLTAFRKKAGSGLVALINTGRMLKILTFFLFAGCLQLSANSYAQGITLSVREATLEKVFKEIQLQTPYRFVYTNEQLEGTTKISFSVENAPLQKVLELCFKDQPLTFNIEEQFIIVKKKEKSLSPPVAIENELKGRVTNDKGEPVTGATVTIKGSKLAAATNNNGEFLLTNVPPGSIIIISSIGYESQELRTGNNRFLSIHLRVSVSALDEMVIKGYYSTSRRLNTGSVSKVTTEEIANQPVNNVLGALQGRVPGLSITQKSGVPGGGFTVEIRGINSIASGNDPFYIIDGVPFTSNSLNTTLGVSIIGSGNPLNNINPADIESIEVLKDADATAIYGSRGANGVILITTKKGKAGKTSLDINAYSGIGKVPHFMDLLNTQQYLAMRREAFANDGVTPTSSNARDLRLWDTTRYTNWQKLLIGNTAAYTDIQVSISGGSQNTQFTIGGGFHKESTVYPGDFSDQKGNVRFSLMHISNDKKISVGLIANYVVNRNNLFSYNLGGYIPGLIPSAPAIYDSTGKLNWVNGTFSNPFAELYKTYKSNTHNLISNVILKYQLLPGISLKTSLGYTRMQVDEIQGNPLNSFNPFVGYTSSDVFTNFANNSIETWIIEPVAEYRVNINQGQLTALVGTTFQNDTRQGQTINATGFSNDGLIEDIGAASATRVTSVNSSQYKYNAVFGRINYNWKDKYLINFTGRRDGSSRFGSDRQFANFEAIGGAWIFSNEAFVKQGLPCLSFGKLRSSYGSTGNDQLLPYQYLSSWQATSYPYQGNAGLEPTRLGNPDYSWEINKKLEFALELGFLRDRIFLITSYYRNHSSNQLVGYPLPASTGFSNIQYNLPALVENTGFELEVHTINLKQKNLSWNSSFNLTFPRNNLIDYPNIQGSSYVNIYEIGKPLTIIKAFHLTGVDPISGVYQFEDVNKDGSPTPTYPADLTVTKKVARDYYGGFSNTLQYKGWRLDVFIQFVKQTGYNYFKSFGMPGNRNNQPVNVLNRWQKPGDITSIQKFSQNSGSAAATAYNNNRFNGDYSISDASFIRLKNVSVSYQFPESKFKKKIGLSNLRIYAEGQNLFTITNYLGLDPETQLLFLPPLRVFTTGIQITF